MKFRLVTILAIASIIFLFGSILISASIFPLDEEISNTEEGFNFLNWLQSTFKLQLFSVVGDYRQCDRTPSKTLTFSKNDYMTSPVASAVTSVCPKYMALIDVFDGKWNAIGEWKSSSFAAICGDSDGCIVEIYCCPFKECTSDSECESFYGAGSECETMSASDPGIVYQDGTTFNYCTEPGSVEVTCYYISGTSCSSKTYIGDTSCPATYNGKTLYSSQSECLSHISTTPYCGDGICNGAETCSSCSADCGTCNGGGTSDIRVIDADHSMGSILEGPFKATGHYDLTLKNFGDASGTINVEAGYYSEPYADNVAQLFSSVGLFSVVKDQPNCNVAEKFVKTKQVTLGVGESKTVQIDIDPKTAFVTFEQGTYNLEQSRIYGFWGLYKQCLGGYINDAGTTGRGVMYDYFTIDIKCPGWPLKEELVYCDGVEVGTCRSYTLEMKSSCDITSTVDVIEKDVPPEEVVFENEGASFVGLKKAALTKEKIKTATTADLLASACLKDGECLPEENYTVSCIKLNSLREEGVLTNTEVDEFFLDSKATITAGAIGGGTALLLCAIAGGVTGGAALAACTVGGALISIGGTIIGADVGISITDILSSDDELTKAIKSGDSNKVGICVKEESSDFSSILKKIGNQIKITGNPTTDGIIILIGGFLAFILLLNIIGGKK